jgi:hypothetical protein
MGMAKHSFGRQLPKQRGLRKELASLLSNV